MGCGKYSKKAGEALTVIQRHLPVGWAWVAARTEGKKLYQLLDAFSGYFDEMSDAQCRLISELNPYSTTELLPEWERSVGLPDECFPSGQTIEERRLDVVRKIERSRYTLIDVWRDLAASMGINATITPSDLYVNDTGYPYDYELIYGGWRAGGRFRIYIEAAECNIGGYSYNYPLTYGGVTRCSEFRCVIERIRPACTIVIWGPPPSDNPQKIMVTENGAIILLGDSMGIIDEETLVELGEIATANTNEWIVIVQNGVTKRVLISTILNYVRTNVS